MCDIGTFSALHIFDFNQLCTAMNNFLSNKHTYTLLYFYPKDNTPGCTLEATDFSRLQKDFENLGVEIIGVSRDSEASHEKFATKHDLSI